MKERIVLGFDIGGTKLGIGLGTESGKILGNARIPNVNTDPAVILPYLVAESKKLCAEAGIKLSDCAGFGISAPFPADAAHGIMTKPTNNPLWRNVPILDYLKTNLNLPGCFENDANCAALAEWFYGAGQGCRNFIYLTMSTGVGGGIISEGKLVRGGASLSAGEMGHVCLEVNGRPCSCGLKGCYEAYCGGRAIALHVREELANQPDSFIMKLAGGDPEKIDMILIEKAVRQNDPYALALWDEMSLRNAQALGMFIQSFNPEKIVLGTLAWAVGDLYTDPIKKYLPQFCWEQLLQDCEIVCSALKREISSYAGIAAAVNYLREQEAK